MNHWREEGHPGHVKVIPEIKSNTLTEPSDKPLEDLLKMRGSWDCEACCELGKIYYFVSFICKILFFQLQCPMPMVP